MAEAQSTILIVDDDAEDLTAVARALGSLGAEVVTLSDPHEVLPAVRGLAPDVVVLDALLPGLSGFDLCKEIKTDPELKATQVMIVTAVYLRQQYRHEALQQFKADAFLTKPFRPPELQRLVVQLLSRKSRKPQGRLLSRLGLPGSARAEKRGLFGRLFGRSEERVEEDTRLTPPRPEHRPAATEPAPEDAGAALEAKPRAATGPSPTDTIPIPPGWSRSREALEAAAEEQAVDAPAAEASAEVSKEAAVQDVVEKAAEVEEGPAEVVEAPARPEAGTAESPEPEDEHEHEDEDEDEDEAVADVEASSEPTSEVDAVAPEVAEPEPEPLLAREEASVATSDSSEDEEGDVEEGPAEGEPLDGTRTEERAEAVQTELFEKATPTEASDDDDRAPVAAADEAIEDAVASVEDATSESEDAEDVVAEEAEEDEAESEKEPSAAEALETAPPDTASDVVWEAAPSGEAAPSFEPSKTLPAVELPDSLKVTTSSPADDEPVEGREPEPDVEAEPDGGAETAEAPLDAPASVEASPPEPRGAPSAPDGEPEAEPEPTLSPAAATAPKRRAPRRRIGEAPLFDEDEFDAELRRELSKCRRVDRPLTLILIQVDDLDQIVELFGKDFREDVLWHVADQAMASLREVDLVGMISSKDRIAMTAFASDRYGGSRIVARMRRSVGKHPIRVGEELPPIIPELAFGMASYPEDADDAEMLMSRAEGDLRGAKAHRED